MKIDFIVISVILVTLVILPFILIPLLQYRENKKLQKQFSDESARLNLNPDLKGNWNQNIIGIDSAQLKMLFLQKISDRIKAEVIDLNQMRSVRVITQDYKPAVGGKYDIILKRVDLEFTHLYKEEKQFLNLFDLDLTFTQDLEVRNAENWSREIQKLLSSRPVLRKSA